ncbi:hypothetical protein TgHK011_008640 [Trichoderma gracile]|nr:hypothetical protein TgHK011_008640 [Trichoderma gracile]
MANDFNLDKFKCPSLPPRFWHVTHQQSQSKIDADTRDLVASDYTREISDESGLGQAAEKHLDWKTRRMRSCFISVFSDGQHASNWAMSIAMDRCPDDFKYDIVEIDTAKLPPGIPVLHALSLVNTLHLEVPRKAAPQDEYLFLHRIPHEAIVNPESLQNLGVINRIQEPKEPDTSDMAVNDRTASPDKQTDLAREFVRLNISKSVFGRPTVVKMRTRKKPIAPVKDEPAIL